MATFKSIDAAVGAQEINATSTTQNHPLGAIIQANDIDTTSNYGVGEFIYAKGVASTVAGDCVVMDPRTWTTVRTVANSYGLFGVAMSANVADQYGWYQIGGCAVVNVLTAYSAAAGKLPYLTATAGQLDDAPVAGDQVIGARALTDRGTPVSTQALHYLTRPYTLDADMT